MQPHATKEEHREVKKQVYSLEKTLPIFIAFCLAIGALVFWQYSALSRRLSLVEHRTVSLQSEVHGLGKIVGEPAPGPEAKRDEGSANAAAAWDAVAAALPQCGEYAAARPRLPDNDALAVLGLSGLVDEGFRPAAFCVEKGGGIIGGILVKAELTESSPASKDQTCEDRCDRIVFVSGEARSGQLLTRRSEHRLGLHAEADSQYCQIDGMVPGTPMTSDTMYLVCGSGEAGGFTHWYTYMFADDALATVQTFDPEKGTYEVLNAAAMEFFRLKRNPERQ